MYRIADRHKRKAEQDEDAIDQHTDSDESSSELDSDSHSSSSEGSAVEEQCHDSVTQVASEHGSLLAKDVIAKPLIPSLAKTAVSCLLCPGKTIKGGKMSDAHLASRAHHRRIKRAAALLKTLPPHTTIEVLLKEMSNVSMEIQVGPKLRGPESLILIADRKKKKDRAFRLQRSAKREADARSNNQSTASELLNQTSSVASPVHSQNLRMREGVQKSGGKSKSQSKKQRAKTTVEFSQTYAKKKKVE